MQVLEFMLGKSKFVLVALVILLMAQSFLGKPKNYLYPVYVLMGLYIILLFLNHFELISLNPALAQGVIGIGIFLVSSSVFLYFAFPMEKLPIPSGEFEIGTRIYELKDNKRFENYTEDKNDKRRLKYQVWYPAEKTDGFKKEKWIHDGTVLTRQLAKSMHMPPFVLDHTGQIDSNSYLNPPVNNSLDKYPLVVISHGWKGFREIHTDYAEELASHGYIAVSIDHTYGSQAVKFNDGRVAYLNKKALPRIAKPAKYDRISKLLVVTYGEDVASVLDDLERVNRNDAILKDKMDLDKIGTLGHSTGGAGVVHIALKDKRIKALMGLDAWLKPIASEIKQGLIIPSLFLRSEQWSKGPNNIALYHLINQSDKATLLEISKTNHVDFSMSYMYSPITKYIGFTGKLGGRVSSEIQRKTILSFFDYNLKDNGQGNRDYLVEILNNEENLSKVDTR